MANYITDYTVEYVPLRFVCETNDGGSYATDAAPGFVNPAVAGFALAAVVCGCAAALATERRARKGLAV